MAMSGLDLIIVCSAKEASHSSEIFSVLSNTVFIAENYAGHFHALDILLFPHPSFFLFKWRRGLCLGFLGSGMSSRSLAGASI